jgi:hypothetical protein
MVSWYAREGRELDKIVTNGIDYAIWFLLDTRQPADPFTTISERSYPLDLVRAVVCRWEIVP